MAIQYVSSGKKGRPVKIDTDLFLIQLEKTIPKAMKRLAEFRGTTKGYRGEKLLGSSTSLPDWVLEAEDLLFLAEQGRELSYQEAKTIRSALGSLKGLASKQERAYSHALSQKLTESYLEQLDVFAQNKSEFIKKQADFIKDTIAKMTTTQKQAFIMSKYYQEPNSWEKYEKAKAWAELDYYEQTGEIINMSMDEVWAYIFARRLQDFGE